MPESQNSGRKIKGTALANASLNSPAAATNRPTPQPMPHAKARLKKTPGIDAGNRLPNSTVTPPKIKTAVVSMLNASNSIVADMMSLFDTGRRYRI